LSIVRACSFHFNPDTMIYKVLSFFAYLSSMVVIGCGPEAETITPQRTDIVESVYASGVLKSQNQYEVFSRAVGVVKAVFVHEGDSIKKGDPLFQIENRSSSITTENARLTALANDLSRNKEKLAEAALNIGFAQNKLSNDSLLFMRQRSLWRQNIGTKVELEQRELSYQYATINLKKSQVAYDDLNRQLNLISEQSRNNLKMAQNSEDDFVIKSEVDGFVYQLNAQKGELANSTTPLAVLGESDFILELNVDELDIVKIKEGQKVVVRLDSYKSEVFSATIRFVYPMMNDRTRSFKVKAVLDRFPQKLYPNLTFEANIIIRTKKGVLTIPTSYLLNDSCVLLENGKTQPLGIGLKDYSIVEVLSGLDSKTRIRKPAP
jgi:HlyD family secretion protein